MKYTVVITGAFGVGKSSAVNCIIQKDGGIIQEYPQYVITEHYAFVGNYKSAYGGVDSLKGLNTSDYADIVKSAFNERDIVFIEGFYLNTFGNNVLRIVFAGDMGIYVVLYASESAIQDRLIQRSGNDLNKNTLHKVLRNLKKLIPKYRAIGVPCFILDTSNLTVEEVANYILNRVKNVAKIL